MNIAIVGNASETLINFRLGLMKSLSAEARVFAVAPDFSSSQAELLKSLNITPIEIHLNRVGLNPFVEIQFVFKLYRFLRANNIQVVLSYFIKPVIYGTLAAYFAGIKSNIALIEGLGFYFMKDTKPQTLKTKIVKFLISKFFRFVLPLSSKVIFLNQDDQEDIMAMVPKLKKIYMLGGIGVDLQEYQPHPKPLGPNLTFVMVCRMLRAKGVIEFIEAARDIKKSYPDTNFLLVGGIDPNPGGLKETEIKQLASLAGAVWLGEVKNVKEVLSSSDVFVLPSYYREGVPKSTQEALAMGMPVITTDVRGCRDTVTHMKNGLLIKPRSSEDLIKAITYFLENKEVVQTFGIESRVMAERHFDAAIKDETLKRILLE